MVSPTEASKSRIGIVRRRNLSLVVYSRHGKLALLTVYSLVPDDDLTIIVSRVKQDDDGSAVTDGKFMGGDVVCMLVVIQRSHSDEKCTLAWRV